MNNYEENLTPTEKEEITFDQMFDEMVELGLAKEEELGIAIHFNGKSIETLNEVLFYKTGYRDLDQWYQYED